MGLAQSLVSLCRSFLFSFLSFSSLLLFQAKIIGAWVSYGTTYLPGFLRPTREGTQGGAPSAIWEGACGLRSQNKFGVMNFIDFPRKPVIIEPLKSLLCYSFRQCRPPEGIPGSNRGWTPVSIFTLVRLFFMNGCWILLKFLFVVVVVHLF